MDSNPSKELLKSYVRGQKILFLSEQCLNLTKKSLSPLLREYGLNHSQFLILLILRYATMNGESVISSDLAYLLAREKHTITPLVDNLCHKGYIHRERSKTDRRAVFIILTEKGSEIIEEVQPKTFEIVGSISYGSEADFKRIYGFLDKFRIMFAKKSAQNPELYRRAYDRLLVNGEKRLEEFYKQTQPSDSNARKKGES